MRKYRLPSIVTVAAIAWMTQGAVHSNVLAGPMNDDSACDVLVVKAPLPDDAETAAAVAVVPAAARPAPARLADRETLEPGERTRIVSYLILRGLQGAGPILGR